MIGFKSVPGYDPDDYRSRSKIGSFLRRWHPLAIGILIFLTVYEWTPIWFNLIPQTLILIIAALMFGGILVTVFGLKVLSIPPDDDYVSPLTVPSHQLELLLIAILCVMIYFVNWPLTLLAYGGVNLVMVVLHLYLLIKQKAYNKG